MTLFPFSQLFKGQSGNTFVMKKLARYQNHGDKREIKPRTCSGSCFLQFRSFINISERILCKYKSSFYQLKPRFVSIQTYLYTQKVQRDLNSAGRKGWIVLLATIKDLGTLVQTTIRLGH